MLTRKIEYIIVHHSASKFGSAEIIRRWHVIDNKWDDIGYNFVITNGVIEPNDKYNSLVDGLIQIGRDLSIAGAHTTNHNADSIGICLIGERKLQYTDAQMISLYTLLKFLKTVFPFAEIKGHKEFAPKDRPMCPDLDMDVLRKNVDNFTFNQTSMSERALITQGLR